MSDLTSQNKALMRRLYEDMWNRADPSIASEIFARPEGVKLFVSQFLLSFPDLQHSIHEMIAENDHVAVRFSARGTHRGAWMHFAPTGKSVHYTGITLAHIAGDKIIEHYTCWDKVGLIEQLSEENSDPLG